LSTPIAVAAALTGAFLLGVSSVADQRSTKRVRTRRQLSPGILLDLVQEPLWLTAVAANLAGFALQVVALNFGSLVLVQPLLVCDLVFAVLISRYLAWRENPKSGERRRRALAIFAGVGAATAGVAGFLVVGMPSGGHSDVSADILVPLVIGLVVVVGGFLAVAARNENLRPLALALACGVNFGVAAFLIKLVTSEFAGGPAKVLTNWPIYLLAVVGPVGYILNQDAFQQGRFLAPVQAIITTIDPVLSIGLGVLWLGVRLGSSPAQIFGQVASLLLMITGVVITAHHAPQMSQSAQ
jgi:hypothetical protein